MTIKKSGAAKGSKTAKAATSQKVRQIVEIEPPMIKLDSLLKLAGIAMTGGEAKEMILNGMVAVDGETCTVRGRKITPGRSVRVKGHPELLVEVRSEHAE